MFSNANVTLWTAEHQKTDEIRDGLCIRYNIEDKKRPLIVHVVKSLLYHMLSTAKCGYTHMRHNKIRDTFADIMHDVCYDVEVEPTLQLLQSEALIIKTISTDENAWLDIKAKVLQGSRSSRCFFSEDLLPTCPTEARKSP